MRLLGGAAEQQVLGRITRNDIVEDRIVARCDRLDDEHVACRTVGRVAGVLAVGTLILEHIGEDFAFQHEFGLRRHLDVDGLAFDEINRLAEQRAGDVELVDLHRDFGSGGEIDRRMHADHDRDLEILLARRAALQVVPDVAA